MTESLERELELVKLQIAAEDCLADAQIDIPLYFSGMIVLWIFGFSVMMQYPASVPAAFMFASIAVGSVIAFGILFVLARQRHQNSIRKLDVYVEDFRAGKPLPSVTTMCGLKEKKVKS